MSSTDTTPPPPPTPMAWVFDALPGAGVTELPALPRAAASWPDDWFFAPPGLSSLGRSSSAGVRVSPQTAMSHAPFWQGLNIIAGDVGQLPLRVQRRETDGEGRSRLVEVDDSPIEWLLNEEPNDFQTPDLFKETLQAWAILHGNGCALIGHNRAGRPEELIPLFPERLTCHRLREGEHVLRYSWLDGGQIDLLPDDVLHVRGLATDGYWGLSAVEVARNVLGLGIAAREHAAGVLKNGGRPSGILEAPFESLDDAARTKLREEWRKVHGGAGGAGAVAILQAGYRYTPLSMTNADAQLMELMKLDRQQVASLLNLPAHMLNALETGSGRANVAESYRDYYRRTLSRWANRWGQECKRKLIDARDRARTRYVVTLDAAVLTEGNSDDRMTRAVQGVRGTLITRNEGRELLGYNPVEDGDEFANPAISTGGPTEQGVGSDDDPAVETTERVEQLEGDLAALREQLRLAEAEKAGLRAELTTLKG